MVEKLSENERSEALVRLKDWTMVEGRDAISKSFEFTDFSEAFGWMTRAALFSQQLNHHPEWTNVWNRVEVVLSTHDAGGLTKNDIMWAEHADTL